MFRKNSRRNCSDSSRNRGDFHIKVLKSFRIDVSMQLGGSFLMSRNRENESFRIVAEGPAEMAEEKETLKSPGGDPSGERASESDPVEASESGKASVHVCGQVRRPGVYELDAESRLIDAVMAAGGFAEGADEDYLNLAGRIADGMKIYVPAPGENLPEEEAPADDGKININTAGPEQLQELPGIGPKRAEDIISYRESHGDFGSPEDIMKVPGIKDAAFAKIRDKIKI